MFKAWENSGTKYWFISPTYDQAKIQYRRMVSMLFACPEVMLKKNQTELRVKLINQSEIRFVSGEVGENLRGESLHGVVIDEVRDQNPDLWKMIIRPMLTTTKGWACFVSTPAGFDAFYDMAEAAKNDDTGLWSFTKAPSTCNPLFTSEEYELAKREMSEAQFRQEIEAEFLDLHSGSAYVNFGEYNVLREHPWAPDGHEIHPVLPILLACDFNLSPMAWVLGQHRAGQFYFFDEIWLEKSHTQEATKELIERLKLLQTRASPKVVICGDASANAGQRAAAGQSDYAILCQMLDDAGISWTNVTPDSNPSVRDRVNTMNARLRSSDGSTSVWFSPKCKQTIKDFQRVAWKKGSSFTLDQTTDPMLTHASDAVGYAISALAPIQLFGDVGTLRVIQR